MKFLSILSIFCFMTNFGIARDTTIIFRQIDYVEVFELAKTEQKPVLLYFHFDGCGACRTMEKTAFSVQNVADFYNEKFICLDVNTRKGEGVETNKIYEVKMHPTFLYLDENGNVLHKSVGVFHPGEFLKHAQNALDPTSQLTTLRRQYQTGNRDGDFLYNYCYALRDAYEVDSFLINEYLNTQSFEELKMERNIRFIYEYAMHNFQITTPFNSRAFHTLLQNKDAFAKYFEPDQVDTRIVWIVHQAIYDAIEKEDEALFNEAIKIISPFDNGAKYIFKEMDGRITGVITSKNLVMSSKMAFYDKVGDNENYQETLNQYIAIIWDDSDALNSIAWEFYEDKESSKQLDLAKEWIVRSIKLNSSYANNDTYAALLFKLKDYEAALQQANEAISIAKKNEQGYDETIALIEKIKVKMAKN